MNLCLKYGLARSVHRSGDYIWICMDMFIENILKVMVLRNQQSKLSKCSLKWSANYTRRYWNNTKERIHYSKAFAQKWRYEKGWSKEEWWAATRKTIVIETKESKKMLSKERFPFESCVKGRLMIKDSSFFESSYFWIIQLRCDFLQTHDSETLSRFL